MLPKRLKPGNLQHFPSVKRCFTFFLSHANEVLSPLQRGPTGTLQCKHLRKRSPSYQHGCDGVSHTGGLCYPHAKFRLLQHTFSLTSISIFLNHTTDILSMEEWNFTSWIRFAWKGQSIETLCQNYIFIFHKKSLCKMENKCAIDVFDFGNDERHKREAGVPHR